MMLWGDVLGGGSCCRVMHFPGTIRFHLVDRFQCSSSSNRIST